MPLPRSIGKLHESIAAQCQCIQKGQRHGRAFVSKATRFQLNTLELLPERVVALVPESGAVTLQEDSPDVLQASLNLRTRAGEPASRELHFAWVNG